MIIYLVRHASAGEPSNNPKKDEKRPLDGEGIDQCGFVGRALAALNAQPDIILSSPLKRATQTASLIGNELGYEGKLQLESALRPDALFAEFRRVLEKYSKYEAIMAVGHNPSITEFLARIIAKSGSEALVDFKKGAVARVETVRRAAVLNWFFTPKIARALHTAAVTAAEKSTPKTSRK
ncbi:MAG: histidine phosphatase family protein [Acidobacteria bacterium]|nr:histidine phosphatase family protein [Acidobacteriota bacterium]